MKRHPHADSIGQMLTRICGEYLEMPGLCLTPVQAQRLWAVDEERCAILLKVLVDVGFLKCTPDGKYVRVLDGVAPSLRVRQAVA